MLVTFQRHVMQGDFLARSLPVRFSRLSLSGKRDCSGLLFPLRTCPAKTTREVGDFRMGSTRASRQPRSQDFFPFLTKLKKGKSPGNEVGVTFQRQRQFRPRRLLFRFPRLSLSEKRESRSLRCLNLTDTDITQIKNLFSKKPFKQIREHSCTSIFVALVTWAEYALFLIHVEPLGLRIFPCGQPLLWGSNTASYCSAT